MARTITEIYDELLAQKEAASELSGLTSSSKTAIWRILLYIVAVVTHIHEQLWDEKEAELEMKSLNTLIGTIPWYIQKLKEFQNGYELELINGTYQYSIIDEEAKIIKRIAINEIEGGIFIKIASEDENNNAIQIEGSDLANILSYINFIKMAGIRVQLVSLPADMLYFDISVYFTGSYTAVRDSVLAAIINYLKNLPFNSELSRSGIITELNNLPNVQDVYIHAIKQQYGVNPQVNIDRAAIAASGYWNIAGGNEFTGIINNSDGSITITNIDDKCRITFIPYV